MVSVRLVRSIIFILGYHLIVILFFFLQLFKENEHLFVLFESEEVGAERLISLFTNETGTSAGRRSHLFFLAFLRRVEGILPSIFLSIYTNVFFS